MSRISHLSDDEIEKEWRIKNEAGFGFSPMEKWGKDWEDDLERLGRIGRGDDGLDVFETPGGHVIAVGDANGKWAQVIISKDIGAG